MTMTLSGNHSASVTALTLTGAADALAVGQLIQVESETMRFRGYGRTNGHRSTSVLNVDRAAKGTTAATHANTTTVTALDADRTAAAIADVSTANGSDLATTQALANALKTKVNAILAALRTSGVIDG